METEIHVKMNVNTIFVVQCYRKLCSEFKNFFYIFRSLYMREDAVTEGGYRSEMLKLAFKTEEDYYVAPPGLY